MLILTIISHKRYIRYAIYHLIITLISLLPAIYIFTTSIQESMLTIIACSISLITFIVSFIMSIRGFKESIVRKFHV